MGIIISKELFEDMAADAEVEETRLDYSGRGMDGRHCVGIVGTMTDLVNFVQTVTTRNVEERYEDNAIDSLAEALSGVEWDSMGYSMIYYWPNISIRA